MRARGAASKSRNGWNSRMRRPRSAAMRRTSAGGPSKYIRSFSKISTPSKPAAAIAVSFSISVPPSETVAIERSISASPIKVLGDF